MSIMMIICKRPVDQDDHMQEAGLSGGSFTRGRSLRMIICIGLWSLFVAGHCLSVVLVCGWWLFGLGRCKRKYFSAANFLIHDECVVLRVCAKLVDTYHCDMSISALVGVNTGCQHWVS